MSGPPCTLSLWLDALFGAEPEGALIELRRRLPQGGMAQSFYPVRARAGVAEAIRSQGRAADLYVGVAPRTRRAGDRGAVERLHVL